MKLLGYNMRTNVFFTHYVVELWSSSCRMCE